MKHFQHAQTTTASRETIWAIWMDVANWHKWDTELESAQSDSDLILGAQGTLKSKGSPKSRFTITEFTDGESFTFTVSMPLAKLHVAHYFEAGDNTTFVHEVWFDGLLSGVFARLLGNTYAQALPNVLKLIQEIAESHALEQRQIV